MAQPQKQEIIEYKAETIWNELFGYFKNEIEWRDFHSRLNPNPLYDLVYELNGKQVLNLSIQHSRGFKLLFKYYSEQGKSELILPRKEFLTVFEYFEPIIYIKGSYSNEKSDKKGLTLIGINQILQLPSFVPTNKLENVSKEIEKEKQKGKLYRFLLGPKPLVFQLLVSGNSKQNISIKKQTDPLIFNLSTDKIQKTFKNFDEIEKELELEANKQLRTALGFANAFQRVKRSLYPLDFKEEQLLKLFGYYFYNKGYTLFQLAIEKYHIDSIQRSANKLFLQELKSQGISEEYIASFKKEVETKITEFSKLLDHSKWKNENQYISNLKNLQSLNLMFLPSRHFAPIVRN